jgi:hypothetical protein
MDMAGILFEEVNLTSKQSCLKMYDFDFKSQNLINLLLCGIATSHIFDDDKCLEGLSK